MRGEVPRPIVQAVSLLGSRTVPSPISPCQSGGSAGTAIAVSDCVNLGTTVPTSLFVAPAHPEAVP